MARTVATIRVERGLAQIREGMKAQAIADVKRVYDREKLARVAAAMDLQQKKDYEDVCRKNRELQTTIDLKDALISAYESELFRKTMQLSNLEEGFENLNDRVEDLVQMIQAEQRENEALRQEVSDLRHINLELRVATPDSQVTTLDEDDDPFMDNHRSAYIG